MCQIYRFCCCCSIYSNSSGLSESSQSAQSKSLNLQMPLAQGKDGKASLDFGKNVNGIKENFKRVKTFIQQLIPEEGIIVE